MKRRPYEIPSILESLKQDVQAGTLTLSAATEELYKAGWLNYYDEEKARRLLRL